MNFELRACRKCLRKCKAKSKEQFALLESVLEKLRKHVSKRLDSGNAIRQRSSGCLKKCPSKGIAFAIFSEKGSKVTKTKTLKPKSKIKKEAKKLVRRITG